MSPDRINYSDVSICQQLSGAWRGELDLPPNRKEQGFQSARDGEKKGEQEEKAVMKVEMEHQRKKVRDVETHTGGKINFLDQADSFVSLLHLPKLLSLQPSLTLSLLPSL